VNADVNKEKLRVRAHYGSRSHPLQYIIP
jgi:hypothetical protein